MLYLMANHASVWNLDRLGVKLGWLIGHDGWRRPARGGSLLPYALDNGMYFPHGEAPHGPARLAEFFGRVAKSHAHHAPLFAVVPDMPYDWPETMERWARWAPRCRELAPAWRWAIAVQNGATVGDLERLGIADSPSLSAVCVGGDSTWKDSTIPVWAKWARERGIWCHVFRVNNEARVNLCIDEGVDSVDGTGLFRGNQRQRTQTFAALRQPLLATTHH
jgi:hypothetical protein